MDWLRQTLETSWQRANLLSYVLLPISFVYWCVIILRRLFYRAGWLKSEQFDVPIVVVGNLTVGGTGKTPLVIYLVECLKQHGYRPGVISRGYGGNATTWPKHVDVNSRADRVGDEPVLIARRAACPIVVGPKRVDNIKSLLKQYECDVVISDDGLQHFALQRDVEIVVTDKTRVQNNHFLLPAGPYREPKSKMHQCDFLIKHITTNAEEPGLKMLLQANQPISLIGSQTFEQTTKIHAVAGIGYPQRFFNTCRQLGYDIIEHAFPDHYDYQASDIFFEDDLPVLMTEKDAVKCFQFADQRHYYLPVSAELSDEFAVNLIQLLREIKQ